MEKYVYIVNPQAKPVADILEKEGFTCVIGDGKLDEAILKKCWAIVPAKEPVDEDFLNKAPALRIVVKKGVGMNLIDVNACRAHGVYATNTPLSNYISVAEHTVTLMLAAAKKLYPIIRSVRCADPKPKCIYEYTPMELHGKTLSVIGLGNIGMQVVRMVSGFGMRVVGYARHPEKLQVPDGVKLTSSMDEALAAGDFISIHVSGAKENKNLIGEREISLMKPTAILINTTRGFIIDEPALYKALTEGRIAGAALDVVVDEPIKADNIFMDLDNVLLTPHCGGFTPEANMRGYEDCARIIMDFAANNG